MNYLTKFERERKMMIKGHPEEIDPLKLKFLKRRLLRYATMRTQGVSPEYKNPTYFPAKYY